MPLQAPPWLTRSREFYMGEGPPNTNPLIGPSKRKVVEEMVMPQRVKTLRKESALPEGSAITGPTGMTENDATVIASNPGMDYEEDGFAGFGDVNIHASDSETDGLEVSNGSGEIASKTNHERVDESFHTVKDSYTRASKGIIRPMTQGRLALLAPPRSARTKSKPKHMFPEKLNTQHRVMKKKLQTNLPHGYSRNMQEPGSVLAQVGRDLEKTQYFLDIVAAQRLEKDGQQIMLRRQGGSGSSEDLLKHSDMQWRYYDTEIGSYTLLAMHEDQLPLPLPLPLTWASYQQSQPLPVEQRRQVMNGFVDKILQQPTPAQLSSQHEPEREQLLQAFKKPLPESVVGKHQRNERPELLQALKTTSFSTFSLERELFEGPCCLAPDLVFERHTRETVWSNCKTIRKRDGENTRDAVAAEGLQSLQSDKRPAYICCVTPDVREDDGMTVCFSCDQIYDGYNVFFDNTLGKIARNYSLELEDAVRNDERPEHTQAPSASCCASLDVVPDEHGQSCGNCGEPFTEATSEDDDNTDTVIVAQELPNTNAEDRPDSAMCNQDLPATGAAVNWCLHPNPAEIADDGNIQCLGCNTIHNSYEILAALQAQEFTSGDNADGTDIDQGKSYPCCNNPNPFGNSEGDNLRCSTCGAVYKASELFAAMKAQEDINSAALSLDNTGDVDAAEDDASDEDNQSYDPSADLWFTSRTLGDGGANSETIFGQRLNGRPLIAQGDDDPEEEGYSPIFHKFKELPLEIRERIYTMVLQSDKPIAPHLCVSNRPAQAGMVDHGKAIRFHDDNQAEHDAIYKSLIITRISRQVRAESLPIFYSANTFDTVADTPTYFSRLQQLGRFHMIRNVSFVVQFWNAQDYSQKVLRMLLQNFAEQEEFEKRYIQEAQSTSRVEKICAVDLSNKMGTQLKAALSYILAESIDSGAADTKNSVSSSSSTASSSKAEGKITAEDAFPQAWPPLVPHKPDPTKFYTDSLTILKSNPLHLMGGLEPAFLVLRMLSTAFQGEDYNRKLVIHAPVTTLFDQYNGLLYFPSVCEGLGIQLQLISGREIEMAGAGFRLSWHQKYQKKDFTDTTTAKGGEKEHEKLAKRVQQLYPDIERVPRPHRRTYYRRECNGKDIEWFSIDTAGGGIR